MGRKAKITWLDSESSQDLAGRSMTKPLFLLDVAGRNEYSVKTLYALYSLALSTFLWVFLLGPCPTNTKGLSCKILRHVATQN